MWDQSQTLPQWLEIRPKLALLFGKMFAQFRKRRIIQSWFQNVFWNQCCDVVHNLPWHFAFSNLYVFHSILLVRSSQIGFKMYTFEVFMWSSLWDAFCGEQKFTPVNGAQWTPIYMAQHKLLKMRGLSYLVHPHFTKSHTNLFKTCHMHQSPDIIMKTMSHRIDQLGPSWQANTAPGCLWQTDLWSEDPVTVALTGGRHLSPLQPQFGKNAAKILAILPLIAEIITKLPKWGSFVACMCHSLLLWNLWPRKPL